jgi:hypothetical protein
LILRRLAINCLHLPFAFNAVTANNVTGVVAIKKWGTGAINETDALVNLGEAIINMSQDIVADQLRMISIQVLRRCLIM